MKKFITLIILFWFVGKIQAQQINPRIFDGISQNQKQKIFLDNYDDNKYGWIKKNSPATHQIRDGYFFFANDYEFSYTDGKAINFDGSKNWELETKIKFLSGDVEAMNGLLWGELIFGDKYFFGFSSMGYYQITKEIGFQTEEKTPATKSANVNKTSENTLVVRKYNNTYFFFLNGNFIYEMPFEDLPGQYIGFSVSKKALMQINSLRLSYITE